MDNPSFQRLVCGMNARLTARISDGSLFGYVILIDSLLHLAVFPERQFETLLYLQVPRGSFSLFYSYLVVARRSSTPF